MSEGPAPAAPGLVSPAKALRVLSALRRTLDEVNRSTVDDAARRRLVDLHRATLIELASAVSDALIEELVMLHIGPLDRDASAAQIKVAEAQLLGWVNGLFLSAGDTDGEPVHLTEDAEPSGEAPGEPAPGPEDETG